MNSKKKQQKYVVVHAGRRDNYEVAVALHENEMLEYLVTDFYAPLDNPIFNTIISWLRLEKFFSKRYNEMLPSAKVIISRKAMLINIIVVFFKKLNLHNIKDKYLGQLANRIALKHDLEVLSMNTYAMYAFKNIHKGKRVLFQFHPQPSVVRDIFQKEIEIFPYAFASLSKEYELRLNDCDIKRLDSEAFLADLIIVASSVTKDSLTISGVDEKKIKIVPYGINTHKFPFFERKLKENKLDILFLGSLNQRKGIIYLLKALDLLNDPNITLNIVGRGIFDKSILDEFSFKNYKLFENIDQQELLSIMQNCDLFVLPSIVEGFGQVILEAMATGLPVICTKYSAGLDIIQQNIDGIIIDPRNTEKFASSIEYLFKNPEVRIRMGLLGREKVLKAYTWNHFRIGIVQELNKLKDRSK
jgi:glycosyltransferase involved in cell wall biosynthesis